MIQLDPKEDPIGGPKEGDPKLDPQGDSKKDPKGDPKTFMVKKKRKPLWDVE